MNNIEIFYSQHGITIKGDEALLAKLPEGYDINNVVLSDDVRINAQQVSIAFSYADSSAGNVDKISYYARIKAEFIKSFELASIQGK